MDDIDQHSRRQFLGLVGAAAAAAGATSLLPPSIVRALSIPAYSATGTIDDVGHVVILMQENRSFDHYFGTLHGVRGFGDRFTVPLPDGRTVWQQSNGTRIVQPYHLDSTTGNAQRVDGTPHSWGDAHDAWDDGRMSAWPEVKDDWSMGYYERAEVPFQFALADAFTLCDAYHCSIQAGTNPNRLFLWTGTNGPTGADVAAVVNEWDSLGMPATGYTWTTYPERLEQAGVSWKVYQSMPDNFGDNSLAGFVNYRRANAAMGNGPDGSPYTVYDEKFEDVDPLIKGIANTMPDGGFLEAFRADVAAGRLPQVSWIVAPETYCEHPGPSSPIQGAYYTSAVLDALTATPDVWARTVLLVNYDENDGFFDHAPPPAAPALGANGQAGRRRHVRRRRRAVHARQPARHHRTAAARRRGLRHGSARADDRRVAVEQGRLGRLAGVRPHVGAAVPRAPLRRGRAEHQPVAAGRGRRPHVGLRLRRPRRPPAVVAVGAEPGRRRPGASGAGTAGPGGGAAGVPAGGAGAGDGDAAVACPALRAARPTP